MSVNSEAVVRIVKTFLKVFETFHQNISGAVLFNNTVEQRPATLLKKYSTKGVFLKVIPNLQSSFSVEYPSPAAFVTHRLATRRLAI